MLFVVDFHCTVPIYMYVTEMFSVDSPPCLLFVVVLEALFPLINVICV